MNAKTISNPKGAGRPFKGERIQLRMFDHVNEWAARQAEILGMKNFREYMRSLILAKYEADKRGNFVVDSTSLEVVGINILKKELTVALPPEIQQAFGITEGKAIVRLGDLK